MMKTHKTPNEPNNNGVNIGFRNEKKVFVNRDDVSLVSTITLATTVSSSFGIDGF